MKKLISILLAPILLFSFPWEKGVEVELKIDPISPYESSHVHLNALFVKPLESFFILFNPRMFSYLNGNASFSNGIGVKFAMEKHLVGVNFSHDFTFLNPQFLHQASGSFEVITNLLDHRINFYLPLKSSSHSGGVIYKTNKWAEYETTYKHRFLHVTVAPCYNFTQSCAGTRLKLTIPFKKLSFNTGVYYDTNKNISSFFSITFKLFTNEAVKNYLKIPREPVIHHHRTERKVNKKEEVISKEEKSTSPPLYGSGHQVWRFSKDSFKEPLYYSFENELKSFVNGNNSEIIYFDIDNVEFCPLPQE